MQLKSVASTRIARGVRAMVELDGRLPGPDQRQIARLTPVCIYIDGMDVSADTSTLSM
jgi:hypothetical protein